MRRQSSTKRFSACFRALVQHCALCTVHCAYSCSVGFLDLVLPRLHAKPSPTFAVSELVSRYSPDGVQARPFPTDKALLNREGQHLDLFDSWITVQKRALRSLTFLILIVLWIGGLSEMSITKLPCLFPRWGTVSQASRFKVVCKIRIPQTLVRNWDAYFQGYGSLHHRVAHGQICSSQKSNWSSQLYFPCMLQKINCFDGLELIVISTWILKRYLSHGKNPIPMFTSGCQNWCNMGRATKNWNSLNLTLFTPKWTIDKLYRGLNVVQLIRNWKVVLYRW